MAIDLTGTRFFGVDLQAATSRVRAGWQGMLRWSCFSFLTPDFTVRVLESDGKVSCWIARQLHAPQEQTGQGRSETAALSALLIPEELFLTEVLRLPHLSENEIEGAVRLRASTISPFQESDVALGWCVEKVEEHGLIVRMVLGSRVLIRKFLQKEGLSPQSGGNASTDEFWAGFAGGAVVLLGYGETVRKRLIRKARVRLLVLFMFMVCSLLFAASSHFLQVRSQVFEAQASYAALLARTGHFMDARSRLIRMHEVADSVTEYLRNRPDPLMVLERLSSWLPDSAWVQRLELNGRTVRLNGQAGDAARLMDLLRARPEVVSVRALGPISRGRNGMDTFSLELLLQPVPGSVE